MEDLKIFDENGKELNIANVIYRYIKANAEAANINIEDVYVGVYQFKKTWIECYEAVDNGYDATDLNCFGEMDEVDL
jgi:hypothetical protein